VKNSMNSPIYTLSIILGIGGAVYLYGVSFDRFSEEELVGFSPFWLLPIIFGLYGFVAEKLLALIEQGEATTIAAAAFIFSSALPFIGIILLLPFLLIKGSKSINIAFLATLFWGGILIVFFLFLFPLL